MTLDTPVKVLGMQGAVFVESRVRQSEITSTDILAVNFTIWSANDEGIYSHLIIVLYQQELRPSICT
jgi:hypothetical protein